MTISRFHVRQPMGSSLCGHACVAMVLGIPLEIAVSLIGHTRGTKPRELAHALHKDLVQCFVRRVRYRGQELPKMAFLAMSRKGERRRFHWVLLDGETVYDPALEAPEDLSRYLEWFDGTNGHYGLTSFLPIGE